MRRMLPLLMGAFLLHCAGDLPEIPLPDLAGAEEKFVAAVKRARAGVRDQPESADAWGALAQVYLIVGENELARQFAASAASAPPRKTMEDPRRARALPQGVQR